MLNIEDKSFFMEIVADAIAQAKINCRETKEVTRWVNAIAKGIRLLEDRADFITVMDDKSLLIWSDSNEIYSANGVCQCRAYDEGIERRGKPFPCKHRALARLVRLYFELQERPRFAVSDDKVLDAPVIGVGLTELACGCLYNWNDKFTEEFCEEHLAVAIEAEREAWEYLNEVV